MSRSRPETIVIVVFAAFAAVFGGCAASGQAPAEAASNQPGGVSHDTPEAALNAFVNAWNAGDFAGVRASFHPDRRPLLDSRRDDVSQKMNRWQIESAGVDSLCHPRGGGWKNTTFTRVTDGAQEDDAAWVHLDKGSWWMYSL